MKTVLITGASTGIGFEFARLFANDGFRLVITSRDGERLRERAKQLHDDYNAAVEVIAEDLALPGAARRVVQELEKRQLQIDILVNNAGFGVYGLFVQTDAAQESALLNVNIVALTELTKYLLPGMLACGQGKILNVASTAAFVPGPGMAVYYASKAYVLSFSEALANELEGTGVTVTVLCPGPTGTEFQKRAGMSENRLFTAVKPMTAARAARKGYLAMQRGQIVAIPGLINKALAGAVRIVPRELLPAMVRALNDPV